ncbi:hypothetical protein SKAU_G00093520 [Synaphobranchus kaupii]|uniref:Uncharacterized protein n=1 Tax=Synaphobranchus kaupii TaxID=118154 RepID=A0A9Q1FWV5_SYNKA|nr:hypothetical protein SKAU_G00093520 [Synaphobranchus kaupii]
MGKHLSPHQVQELKDLIIHNRDVFSDQPGRTNVIAHDIITEPGKRVRLRPYRILETRREAVRDEETGMPVVTSLPRGPNVEGEGVWHPKWLSVSHLALCKGLPLEDTSWAGHKAHLRIVPLLATPPQSHLGCLGGRD